ncbi:MAG: hypothetical protein ABI137_10560, partial [Antricoccus sp.]
IGRSNLAVASGGRMVIGRSNLAVVGRMVIARTAMIGLAMASVGRMATVRTAMIALAVASAGRMVIGRSNLVVVSVGRMVIGRSNLVVVSVGRMVIVRGNPVADFAKTPAVVSAALLKSVSRVESGFRCHRSLKAWNRQCSTAASCAS